MRPDVSEDAVVGRASGRLDLLGGVADYAGALVLETPTRAGTTVTAAPADALIVGPAELSTDEVEALAQLPYEAIRRYLADRPKWTHYPIGVAIVLVRHGVIAAPRAELTVSSDVPLSVGVSSSAALEVATARALGVGDLDPLELAARCQEAENQVVGAPCGIMDQVVVAAGTVGEVLPILCRPASVLSGRRLPDGVEVVGWPIGAEHDVSGRPYRRARTAAFMGKRMAEVSTGLSWEWISALPRDAVNPLPDEVFGAAYLDRYGDTDDPITEVDPDETYPVRAAALFGGEEHARAEGALPLLDAGDIASIGPLMAASHAGYQAIGLGHPRADEIVAEALARPGVHGARSSGGGAGGTVVVLCAAGALDDVPDLIR